jgi:hypothetical protein
VDKSKKGKSAMFQVLSGLTIGFGVGLVVGFATGAVDHPEKQFCNSLSERKYRRSAGLLASTIPGDPLARVGLCNALSLNPALPPRAMAPILR